MKNTEILIDEITYNSLKKIELSESEDINEYIKLIPELNYETFMHFITMYGLESNEAAKAILNELSIVNTSSKNKLMLYETSETDLLRKFFY